MVKVIIPGQLLLIVMVTTMIFVDGLRLIQWKCSVIIHLLSIIEIYTFGLHPRMVDIAICTNIIRPTELI